MKIYGNSQVIGITAEMVRKGREPHSLMIHGEKGLGKKAMAKYIAAQLMCEKHTGTPCGRCRACTMLNHGAHPDFITAASNEKGNYLVEDIREQIVSDAVVMPNEGDIKVYVIPDLDLSTITSVQVQNILLKLIEEPPDHTALILTARSKEIFLPTIISRCLCLGAVSVTEQESGEYLQENFPEASAQEIGDAVRAGHGNIGRCRDYLEKGSFYAAAVLAGRLAGAYITGSEYEMLKALSSESKKPVIRESIYLLSEIVRDAGVLASNGKTSPMISCDSTAAAEISRRLTPSMSAGLYDTLTSYVRRIDANCNLTLAVSSLCAELSL